MNFRRVMAGLILMGLSATPALAQKSLGDLLDGGAKKLSKEAVQSTIGGAQISGTSTTGAATDYHYTSDGKFSGKSAQLRRVDDRNGRDLDRGRERQTVFRMGAGEKQQEVQGLRLSLCQGGSVLLRRVRFR